MNTNFELRTPPPTRPLPSQAEIERILDELLLDSEADMFRYRPAESRDRGRPSGPLQKTVDDVDMDDMHDFVTREDAVYARNAADEKAYAQYAAAAAAQAAAAGAAQDAIDRKRQDAFDGLNRNQKAYIEIKNRLTGGKMTEFDFNYYNSLIKLNLEELDGVQPFIYQTAEILGAARGAAASGVGSGFRLRHGGGEGGGKRKSNKYRYKKKSNKSKANKRRRSRSNKRSRSRK